MKSYKLGANRKLIKNLFQSNANSNIKSVIAVVSGKGGVGKSSMSSLIAVGLNKSGFKTGIFDTDITGASIPKMFGITCPVRGDCNGMIPPTTKSGIKLISINLFLENEDDPVIWRGPMLSKAVHQFWSEVQWGVLDYLVLDLPPGTGDVPLTIMESLPVDGIIVVTSPQEISNMVVTKAVKMASMMNIPIIALIENFSHVICPGCGVKINLFGESKAQDAAVKHQIPFWISLPIDKKLAEACDNGQIEEYDCASLQRIVEVIKNSDLVGNG